MKANETRKTVEITREVFAKHIRSRVTKEYRTYADYKRAFPNAKAVFLNGKLFTVV